MDLLIIIIIILSGLRKSDHHTQNQNKKEEMVKQQRKKNNENSNDVDDLGDLRTNHIDFFLLAYIKFMVIFDFAITICFVTLPRKLI